MGLGSVDSGTHVRFREAVGWQFARRFRTPSRLSRPALQAAIPFLLALVTLTSSYAKTHPVPLEPGTDAAKCISCHEKKTKGKSVHSAIATGCLSCHEVRISKDLRCLREVTHPSFSKLTQGR